VKFYVVGGDRPGEIKKPWLTEEQERMRRMTSVLTTADTFPICEGKIVAVWRTLEPMANRWLTIGGAMKVGESPQEAAARLFKGDTGLERKPEDFRFIANEDGLPDQFLMLVKNPAGDYWRQDTGLYFSLVVAPEELSRFKLDPKEYSQKLGLFSFEEVLEKVAKGELEELFARYAGFLRRDGLL